jgi:hypothetical protein
MHITHAGSNAAPWTAAVRTLVNESVTAQGRHTFAAALAAVALALGAGACKTDKILSVPHPDIIEPKDIRSAAGAEALRVGTLRQVNLATGGEDQVDPSQAFLDPMFMLSGLLADEFRSGDTFVERNEIDQRAIRNQNANLDAGYRFLHRARVNAQITIEAITKYNPSAPPWQVAQMYWLQGYTETLLAEYFCSGVPVSTADLTGAVQLSDPLTTEQMLERAGGHFDQALTTLGPNTNDDTDAARVRNLSRVGKGRALIDLKRYSEAAAAVAPVPTSFEFDVEFNQTTVYNAFWSLNNNQRRYTVAAGEGGVGLDFATAMDPRLPVCRGGDAACLAAGVSGTRIFDTQFASVIPFYVQLKYPARDIPLPLADGKEARLIEAEAQLNSGGDWLGTLNALRAMVTGLAPLSDPGTQTGRVDLLFRERAFWLFGTGHRLGDMRRLVRQYGRPVSAVFPTGEYPKGGQYGPDVNFPVSQSEENNPKFHACLNRDA